MPSVPDAKYRFKAQAVCDLPLSADELLRALLYLSPRRRLSILDSCGARGSSARFLIAGFDPFEIIEARGQRVRVSSPFEKNEYDASDDVLAVLDKRLAAYRLPLALPEHLPVAGACI